MLTLLKTPPNTLMLETLVDGQVESSTSCSIPSRESLSQQYSSSLLRNSSIGSAAGLNQGKGGDLMRLRLSSDPVPRTETTLSCLHPFPFLLAANDGYHRKKERDCRHYPKDLEKMEEERGARGAGAGEGTKEVGLETGVGVVARKIRSFLIGRLRSPSLPPPPSRYLGLLVKAGVGDGSQHRSDAGQLESAHIHGGVGKIFRPPVIVKSSIHLPVNK